MHGGRCALHRVSAAANQSSPPSPSTDVQADEHVNTTDAERSMSFDNFLARQSLRDEAMASASAAWLAENPAGLLVGLMGLQHVKFSCGVPARAARMLPGGADAVASVLLNPTPANTFDDPFNLRVCDRSAVADEACLRNDIELQNYVLQRRYGAGSVLPLSVRRGRYAAAVLDRGPLECHESTVVDRSVFVPG